MSDTYSVMPYNFIVGQEQAKLALELAFIAPEMGGALLSGQRGTGKSTLVRAFHAMMFGPDKPPVTIPMNATTDRVVGGWYLESLTQGAPQKRIGLIEEANRQILYIDEVNLLDDHIVNLLLDSASSHVLTVEREGLGDVKNVSFLLVGTMNPEEGGLRPQLLDRFGLMAHIEAEKDPQRRLLIVQNVLAYQRETNLRTQGKGTSTLSKARSVDAAHKTHLQSAKARAAKTAISDGELIACATVASQLQVQGNRGELNLAFAARALAALEGVPEVAKHHIAQVAPLVLQHRRRVELFDEPIPWTEADMDSVNKALGL